MVKGSKIILLIYYMGNITNSNLSIFVCDSQNGVRILDESEKIDKYRTRCLKSRSNNIARARLNYSPIPSSKEELQNIETHLTSYITNLPKVLQDNLNTVKIIIMMPSADGCMPHTRANGVVCLPLTLRATAFTTFLHELWHCHQKTHNKDWLNFYELSWDMKPWNESETLPVELADQVRINPDTCEMGPMIWRNRWVALPIFLSPTAPELGQCSIWWWDNVEKKVRHSAPVEWAAFFTCEGLSQMAYEHPNEISAYYLSSLDILSHYTPALKILLEWLKI